MKKATWTAAVVVMLAAALGGCKPAPAPEMPIVYDNLQKPELTAVAAEPDAMTKALADAGYKPFGKQYRLPDRDGKHGYMVIYYGQPGASIDQAHGSTAKPWASRSLKQFPVTNAGWRDFNPGLIFYGDDWPGKDHIRPADAKGVHYQCSIDPSVAVTADEIKQLPATVMKHEANLSFTLAVGGQTFSCFKQ